MRLALLWIMSARAAYRRADGVRITHDPFAPGMAEKYGAPGQTDQEGFDPYGDTVGAGIYSGTVKRDPANGAVLIGRQYQDHNPRPGPVYSGGGYTPVSQAIAKFHQEVRGGRSEDDTTLARLLDKHPDLANDVATGGASPLHTCGMSQANQYATEFVISRGADIAAVDTYGYTPLDRMASNNLAVGAKALLSAGADPARQSAEVARQSDARDALAVISSHEREGRLSAPVQKLVVYDDKAGVDGTYHPQSGDVIPAGFAKVCVDNGWDVDATWKKLNGGEHGVWFKRDGDDAYIYHNAADGAWWVDGNDGLGVFKGRGEPWAPMGMATAWSAVDPSAVDTQPTLAIFR